MPIERFIWTLHAERRRARRLIDRIAVERAVRERHADRQINRGDAAWRIEGLLPDGRRFIVVYDHPRRRDLETALIASVWDL